MKHLDFNQQDFWKPEFRLCPVCGGDDYHAIGFRGGNAHRLKRGSRALIVRCDSCSAQYAWPTMIPIGNPYDAVPTDKYFENHDESSAIQRGHYYAEKAEEFVGGPGKMLEVGCGRGSFLVGAAERGWDVYGVDMTPAYVEHAHSRGISVECASAMDAELLSKESYYDAILLLNILEHLYEPAEVLKRVATSLKPGGVVAIGVPNEASLTNMMGNLYMKTKGLGWCINLSPTFPPFHVVGFTPEALGHALKSNGLETLVLKTVRGYNNYSGTSKIHQKLESIAVGVVQTVGAKAGTGDAIHCWARRPI